jgi:hypothetical protein
MPGKTTRRMNRQNRFINQAWMAFPIPVLARARGAADTGVRGHISPGDFVT